MHESADDVPLVPPRLLEKEGLARASNPKSAPFTVLAKGR